MTSLQSLLSQDPVDLAEASLLVIRMRAAIRTLEAERELNVAEIQRLDLALAREREEHGKSTGFVLTAREQRDRFAKQLQEAQAERDAYRAMVCDLLASAHPHPTEHPTMTKQWARARELLKNGPPHPDKEHGHG
jgi:hypothetical protein